MKKFNCSVDLSKDISFKIYKDKSFTCSKEIHKGYAKLNNIMLGSMYGSIEIGLEEVVNNDT